MSDLAESKVKIEMMDKRLENANKEANSRVDAVEERVNKAKLLLENKEK